MTLPTTYADGNTIHGADLNTWDTAINALTNALTPGFTSTVTSGSPVTLVSTSPSVQVFTGSTAQTVLLPTTGVVAGCIGFIINNSTAAITVQSSGANTISTVAVGTAAMFMSLKATPTAAADWECVYWGDVVASGKSLTVNNTLTIAGTDGTTMTFPASTGNVVAPPTLPPSFAATVATTSTAQMQFASLAIPAGTLTVGQSFKVKVFGTQSATLGTLTFQIHCGTANTTLDAVICSAAPACAASGAAHFEGLLTFRTVGASGTCIASGIGDATCTATITASTSTGISAGLAGINASRAVSTQVSVVTLNTTSVASPLFVTVSCGPSAGTYTAQQTYISFAEA